MEKILYLSFCWLSLVVMTMSQAPTDPPQVRRVTIPPLIEVQPEKKLAFRVEESIEMMCEATGQPDPVYKWQMNGKDFDPSGNDGRIAIQPGVGTLIFARPLERDEGIYQCMAENSVGVSVSVKVDLRQGYLDPFIEGPVRQLTPVLGHHVELKCNPPRSYPQPDIFWAIVRDGRGFEPIQLTSRISIDPVGNLHIAHVTAEDKYDLASYVCVVSNTVMRRFQQGSYHTISPQGASSVASPPEIRWQDAKHQIALRGDRWSVKCIFSGNPTPRVTWERLNLPMPDRKIEESFGQELVITSVMYEDAGQYECSGINEGATKPVRLSYDLVVESAPQWTKEPLSVDAASNETAVFECEADGIPQPQTFWYINGIPISKVPADPRRVLEKNKMTFYDVSKDDAQVIQCNATNKHGYIFKNVYLNVLEEPPIITEPPLEGQKAAEGQTIELRCTVFGSPKPIVVWRKGNEQLTGGRFQVMESGNLLITDVLLVDAGTYTCTAKNKFDIVEASGTLIVRRKTLIETAPRDLMVFEDTEAKFTCTASTDPEEVKNLQILWKKDGEIIDYAVAQRMFRNEMDNSLTISGTISLDTGEYTCVATNGLDTDESSAQLVVQGAPDPPTNVRVLCRDSDRIAEVEWNPGKENYAPILNFVIQFNTSFSPDTWYDVASDIGQNVRRRDVELSPYGNYTFRVLARNKIGISQPSKHTDDVCKTKEAAPTKNPDNVIGEGDEPNNLVIYWTPMPEIEHNGQNFKYLITWWEEGKPETAKKHTVERPEYYHYVVPDSVPIYTPYIITVQSRNGVGPCETSPVEVKGFSGEDSPTERVTDLYSDPASVNGDSVILQWTHVNTDPEVIRGYFRGYRIQFWKTSEGEEYMREDDYIINATTQYPRPRYRRDIDENNMVTYELKNLPPFSDITIQVRILNKYYAGPASERIFVTTLEGQPGPPASFDVITRGSTHFELEWSRPVEENGVLVGYNISYQRIIGLNLGRIAYREPISNPDQIRARLTGLQPEMEYRVYLAAATSRGMGENIFLDSLTTKSGTPNPPTFNIIELSDTWVYVMWEPSRGSNPGSVFYVQYRPRASYHWLAGADESLHYETNVTALAAGTTYQIRVVSKNGEGYEAPSEWQEFTTGGLAPGRIALGAAGWFYGIFAALLLIVLIMIAFILIKRKRDEWWDRKEADINDQMRQLQSEEAARQLGFGLGIDNAYAQTGSREMLADNSTSRDASHADLDGSISKPPLNGYDPTILPPPPVNQQYSGGVPIQQMAPQKMQEEEEEESEEESEYTDDSEEEDEEEYTPQPVQGQPVGYNVGYQQPSQSGYHPGYQTQDYQQPPPRPPPKRGYYPPSQPQAGQQQYYDMDEPSSPDGRQGSSFV